MEKIELYDQQMYACKYCLGGDSRKYRQLWKEVSSNLNLLEDAVTIMKTEYNHRDTVMAPTVAAAILDHHNNVNQEIYGLLIDNVFSDRNVARTTVERYSLLLKALMNEKLSLDGRQKQFLFNELIENYSNGKKSLMHGYTPYDARYYALKNISIEEDTKIAIVKNMYTREEFDDCLETWKFNLLGLLNYQYDYYEIKELNDQEIVDQIGINGLNYMRNEMEFINNFRKKRHAYTMPKEDQELILKKKNIHYNVNIFSC